MDQPANMQTPALLRPVHSWFWFWEGVISSIYRVVAVIVGAAITAAVVAAVLPVPWWLVGLLALAGWAGLAVLQEHDERVHLPVDSEFLEELHTYVDPVMAASGYEFTRATGANRARRSAEEFLYEKDSEESVTCRRNTFTKTMSVIAWRDSPQGEPSYLPSELAARLAVATDPRSDALVLAEALSAWANDPALRLPVTHERGNARLRRRVWFNYR